MRRSNCNPEEGIRNGNPTTPTRRAVWLLSAVLLAAAAACNQGKVITDPILSPNLGQSAATAHPVVQR